MRTMARSWKSKMGCYEIPCAVKGGAAKAERRLRGNTYQHPYDRTVGTWKTGNAENAAARRGGWKTITILYPGESGGTVLMKQAHKPVEGRPPVGNSSLIFDRAPCAVKAARTVLSGGKSGEKVKNGHQRITYRNLALSRRELSIIWLSSWMNSYPERRKHDPDEPDPAKRPAHVSPNKEPNDTNEGGCHGQAARENHRERNPI